VTTQKSRQSRRAKFDKSFALLVAASAVVTFLLSGCSATLSTPKAAGSIPKEKPVSATEKAMILATDQHDDLTQLHTRYPNAKPGPVSVVRYIKTKDWAGALSNCMQTEGFRTTVAPDGGLQSPHLPAQQQEPYALAFYTCQVQYPINPVYEAPLSTAEVKFLYGYVTGTLTICLHNHGVPLTNAPSERTFADTYAATGGWTPYSEVTDVSESEWVKLNKDCPQKPAGFRGN
jgi:hypothetical protein